MLNSLKNFIAAPLTKYMGIAILVLASALGGAMYLSYKFYGQKAVAEQQSTQLRQIVKEEREQTDRAIRSSELLDQTVSELRDEEQAIERASQELQNHVEKTTPSHPTGDCKDASEMPTERSGNFLTDADIRLLQQAHCLTDGDPSDCDLGESK